MREKTILSDEERRSIAEAVAEAEKLSGGEIVTAVIQECDDYGFRELLFAVIVGVLSFNILLFFSNAVAELLASLFWGLDSGTLPFFYGLGGLIAGALAYALVQIPALDRLIISDSVMHTAVKRRAARYFMESGAYDTVDQTGILIFVSLLERRVELIADRGINALVPSERWNQIVNELTAGIAGSQLAPSLINAVNQCGGILAEHIERRQNDQNELTDKPRELGRGS